MSDQYATMSRIITMQQTNFDAIVIGAGPGGATIASLLANDGKRVLLIDKNASAGGKMTTLHGTIHSRTKISIARKLA